MHFDSELKSWWQADYLLQVFMLSLANHLLDLQGYSGQLIKELSSPLLNL